MSRAQGVLNDRELLHLWSRGLIMTISKISQVLVCSLAVTLAFGQERATGAAPAVLTVQTATSEGEIDLTRYALGQGGLSPKPMIDEHTDQIAQLHPQTIRLFVKDFFDIYPGHGEYHWDTLDKAIEARLATGAEPIMTLAFKPRVLYPQLDDTIVVPTSYDEWDRLIEALVKHVNRDRHYGIRYWEIGNEVDIGEPGGCPYKFTPENYIPYYRHTAEAIRRADPAALIGGPALARYTSPIADSLIAAAGKGEVPLNFLSWHIYNNDPHTIAQTVAYMKAKLNHYESLSKTETILDEWNMSLGQPILDPAFQPAFILETTFGFEQQGLSRSAYYHIRDYIVDQRIMATFMSPRGAAAMEHWWDVMPQYDGLFDNQGRVRPAYYAFKLLSLIRGEKLPVSSSVPEIKAFAAKRGNFVNVVLWNFSSPESKPPYNLKVNFPGEGKGTVRIVKLNSEAPVNNLQQTQNEHVDQISSHPFQITMRPYDIVWIELTQ